MSEIKIDYDNIDVTEIMKKVQADAAALPKKVSIPKKSPPSNINESSSKPSLKIPEPEQVPLELPRWRRILLKLMKPFSPLIKMLILPVHQELLETNNNLDYSNKRLDYLNKKIEAALSKLSNELYSASDKLYLKIDGVNQSVNERMDLAFNRLGDLDKTMEYVKLLHSLCHNIVVELTKLKVEEEGIKVKTRILEKDFEFLSRKEKILEKKAFK